MNGTPTKHAELPSNRSIPQRCRVPAIYDVIRTGERVVRVAVESKIDLPNALLHGANESEEIAESIFVRFAAFDAGHGQNGVIEDEPDVGGISRRWAGQNLSN
jgi:hypothetical protein